MGDVVWDFFYVVPDKTKCKHGTADCRKCGSSNRMDAKHSTKGGKGSIGRLIAKDKKKRK